MLSGAVIIPKMLMIPGKQVLLLRLLGESIIMKTFLKKKLIKMTDLTGAQLEMFEGRVLIHKKGTLKIF